MLDKGTDKTIIERKPLPGEGTLLSDVGILSQKEIEELSDIALGAQTSGAHATQFWEVQVQTAIKNRRICWSF